MEDQLREYHDALVRLDALVLQLSGHLDLALVGADYDCGDLAPALHRAHDIANRMDEVIPDAIKVTRPTKAQRAMMAEMARCPDCGGPLETGDGKNTPPVYCPRCKHGWDRPEDVVVMVPHWEGPALALDPQPAPRGQEERG